MGLAIYVTIDREVPGVNGWDMGGKILASNIEKLDQAAKRLGIRRLSEFQSMGVNEFSALVGSDEDPIEAPSASLYDDMRKHRSAEAVEEFRTLMETAHAEIDTAMSTLKNAGPPVEEWFAPSEGLAIVEALMEYVRNEPEGFDRVEDLLGDLEDVRRYLRAAEQHGARFHLSLDF